MPPPVGAKVEEPRLPHPRSLAPLSEVFPDGANARSELAAARRLKMVVPPIAHRRTPKSPLEVRIRANVIALLDIDAVQQTFTAHFFLDATWVRRAVPFCASAAPACVPETDAAADARTRAQVDTSLSGDELKLPGPQTVNVALSDQVRGVGALQALAAARDALYLTGGRTRRNAAGW